MDWLLGTERYSEDYSLLIDESVAKFSADEKRALLLAVVDIDARLAEALASRGQEGLGYGEAFQQIYGLSKDHMFRIVWATCPPGHKECESTPKECTCVQPGACQWVKTTAGERCGIRYGNRPTPIYSGMYTVSAREIRVLSFWNREVYKENYMLRWRNNFVHEFGHALDNQYERVPRQRLQSLYYQPKYREWLFNRGVTFEEYRQTGQKDQGGFRSPKWQGTWQQHAATIENDGIAVASAELWADMFLGWVYRAWELDENGHIKLQGAMREQVMDNLMSQFIKPQVSSQQNAPSIPHKITPTKPYHSRIGQINKLPDWR